MNTSPTDDDPPSNLYENDTILKFISEILMEEEDELENQPSTLHHSLALQATEKSFYDALINNNNVDLRQNNDHGDKFLHHNQNNTTKHRNREEDEEEYHRSNKQSANNNNVSESESEPLEMYDDFLLRSDSDKSKNKSRGKKQDMLVVTNKEFVDLGSLLMKCAQAVADLDYRTVNDLITQIRLYSSPHGDGAERVAHYFADAIEARLSSNRTALHRPNNYRSVPFSGILKAYKMFIKACPFMTMSNLFAKQTLLKLADGATTLHIVDFGIVFGFQWPCLILALSERPGGPPKLRITGIDFPIPGFRPDEMVTDTGRRLAGYCERFGVPFEYNAIARKWDTIRPEDLKVEKGEVLVVNCLYRLHSLTTDEAETVGSPRDVVLRLMKKINPDMFVHGIVNARHNTPFFLTRFREAFFYYLAMFDMLEATVAREDEDQIMRVGYEEHLWGKGVMNIVACEGDDRTERPAMRRQWELRTQGAGFKQLPIDGEIVKCVGKVKKDYNYHKDFSVDKDREWLVLGWKGRIINAISCWH